MTQTAASPKPNPLWVTAHKSWETRAHFTASRQLSRLENTLYKRLCWSNPFGSSVGLFLPSSWSGLQSLLCTLVCLRDTAFIDYSGGKGPSESGQVLGPPRAALCCLKSFTAGQYVSISEETVTQHTSLLRHISTSEGHTTLSLPELSSLVLTGAHSSLDSTCQSVGSSGIPHLSGSPET